MTTGSENLLFIDGIVDFHVFTEKHKQSVEKLESLRNFYFYQDDDAKHTTRIVKEWILCNISQTVNTSTQNTDINSIEYF